MLLFLTLSDFLFLGCDFIAFLYCSYFLFYVFGKKKITISPNFFLFRFCLLNLKNFLNFLKSNFFTFVYFFQFKLLRWKPLFKRSSYFGLYRSSRNQWLNK